MEQQRQSVDWTGRILSIVSLVIAVGIGGYVVTQGQVAGTRDELLTKFGQELQGMITVHEEKRNALENTFTDSLDRNDKRMNDWNNQLVTAINSFDRDAKQMLDQIAAAESRASENRLAEFKKEMVELRKLAVNDPGESQSSEKDSPTGATSPDATQFAVHTVLKVIPPDTQDQALIQIENSTEEDALIQRIQFKPEADFRVQSSDAADDYANIDSILVFPFYTSDNTSTKPDHHGLYDRKLTNPIRIPAGETLTMRVVITDDYPGWGFVGQLRLVYNSDEPLLIKTARVHFENQAESDDTELDDLFGST